jgi:hypothetical protein
MRRQRPWLRGDNKEKEMEEGGRRKKEAREKEGDVFREQR